MKLIFDVVSTLGMVLTACILGSCLLEAFKAILLRSEAPQAASYIPLSNNERKRLAAYAASLFVVSHCEFTKASEWFV